MYLSKKVLTIFLLSISILGCSHAPHQAQFMINKPALASCPSSPNCVSSLQGGDAHIAPIQFNPTCEPIEYLAKLFHPMSNITITYQSNDYLRIEVTSNLFGFIDDVEFRIIKPLLHIRSASRSGYYDFGVNRARLEGIRTQLQSEC